MRRAAVSSTLAPSEKVAFDPGLLQEKEARLLFNFRYAHVYGRAVSLISSGALDLQSLITDTYPFEQSVEAFDYALTMSPESVKIQIVVDGERTE